jgi:DnaJ-class molecular chaperone
MRNPYEVLGVAKSATEDEIRKAYRKLAKRHHPDLNQGDAEAERRFKEVNAANDLLSDAGRRARFDRGEIDAAGNETPMGAGFGGFGGGGFRPRPGADPFGGPRSGPIDLDDLLEGVFSGFGRRAGGGGAGFGGSGPGGAGFGGAGFGGFGGNPPGGEDRRHRLEVDFLTAAAGGSRRLRLEDGRTVDVAIPAGVEDGTTLRLKGQGATGRGGAAGDALVEVKVAPHRHFRRAGEDVHLDLPVTLREAVLGARVKAPTLGKPVMLTVPPGSDGGTVLRLKGKGIHRKGRAPGDLIVTLRIVLGPGADDALRAFLESRPEPDGEAGFNPRAGLLG